MKKSKSILQTVKQALISISQLSASSGQRANYRVINIEQDKRQEYQAIIQVVGKGVTFKMKPEEILADDNMTNQFSPCDVRTLTYLGYLGINSPKYKILAKQLSKENDKLIFAVHEKHSNKITTRTASEISSDKEILKSLAQEDAHMVGYTAATEKTLAEEKDKLKLLQKSKNKSLTSN